MHQPTTLVVILCNVLPGIYSTNKYMLLLQKLLSMKELTHSFFTLHTLFTEMKAIYMLGNSSYTDSASYRIHYAKLFYKDAFKEKELYVASVS